ncbi:hypothetical protein J7L13_01090 [bacterium]|nr:hypothetical protein [bacterium]
MKDSKEVSAQVENAPTRDYRKVKRYYLIRQKLCKIGSFLEVLSFVFAVLTIFYPKLWSLFVFLLIDWILTILPSYFLQYLEIRREKA